MCGQWRLTQRSGAMTTLRARPPAPRVGADGREALEEAPVARGGRAASSGRGGKGMWRQTAAPRPGQRGHSADGEGQTLLPTGKAWHCGCTHASGLLGQPRPPALPLEPRKALGASADSARSELSRTLPRSGAGSTQSYLQRTGTEEVHPEAET